MDYDLNRSHAGRLADLMGLDEPARGETPAALSQILSHQLRAPLLCDLSPGSPEARRADSNGADNKCGAGGVAACGSAASMPVTNFGELLTSPSPPLELLVLTKEFAKSSDSRREAPLPPQVATALYYAAILAALVRHGRRISDLGDCALRDGAMWGLQQPWLDESIRPLFVEGWERLNPRQAD